jgi:hypothetical protein
MPQSLKQFMCCIVQEKTNSLQLGNTNQQHLWDFGASRRSFELYRHTVITFNYVNIYMKLI